MRLLMRLLIRADGDARIGGGHVMRCLALAAAAQQAGHSVTFLTATGPGHMAERIAQAGCEVITLPPASVDPDPEGPAHQHWLVAPWRTDAALTAQTIARLQPDWLIWDHYGLDARWVSAARAGSPALRVMAIDDLDDRTLGSDLVLDQTRINPGPRHYQALSGLNGPNYALLRPEFAAARPTALTRRGGAVGRVLIAPGMGDAAGLAPLALAALADSADLSVDVVMGRTSASVPAVQNWIATHPDVRLILDTSDMAGLLTQADLCIGAGGMSSWERCSLGLPAVVVEVADNQHASIAGLVQAGAAIGLTLGQAQAGGLGPAIAQAIAQAPTMAARAAALCDGQGTGRVLSALSGQLRAITAADARLLFDWRGQPKVRAASLNQNPLIWEDHLIWLEQTLKRPDSLRLIYSENSRPLGSVNAVQQPGHLWLWSFHIGPPDTPKGTGGRMLATFLHHLMQRPDMAGITAQVRHDNAASLALHRALGFRQAGSVESGLLAFSLDRCDVAARLGMTP